MRTLPTWGNDSLRATWLAGHPNADPRLVALLVRSDGRVGDDDDHDFVFHSKLSSSDEAVVL
jgi:hypothetical protein